ncbi:MAG: hypothetical protein DRN15_04310 [Thermoprotei archaeon]|nr:MAG: hypothetical protein DRN15_04310 [Thermoprotei archaeon]RLF24631.1 MAG: hypothetical protein DRM97_03275 [Thermoprotei archaeon]
MVESKAGMGIGEEIIESIRDAKERVWVCTPFISIKYAKLLAEKASEGLDVRIITSPSSSSIRALDAIRDSDVRIKIVEEAFIHAKLYIIDDVTFTGSVNLTESSIEKNYEVLTVFRGEEGRELREQFL